MTETELVEKPAPNLSYERLKFLYETKIKPVAVALQEAEGLTKEMRLDHEKRMAEFALSLRMGKLDEDALGSFFKKPYPKLELARDGKGRLIPNTWKLSIPRFIPLSVGFLESQDEAWNYYRVNRNMDWFGEIPDFIKKQIGMQEHPEFEGLKIQGGDLVGPRQLLRKVWEDKRFKGFLEKIEGNRIKVHKDSAYELTVALLKEGVKPFSQNPIDPADIITPSPLLEGKEAYQLRPYQKTIWEMLCKFSSIGVFIPPSTGKTVLGVYAATHLKPPHLVVAPTNTLIEQWEERIESHSALKLNEEIFVTSYQTAIKKMSNREWVLVILDEVHHIGAKYFIKLSWLKRKYSLGLSATPYREDPGGEELIFALTGEPTGLAWQHFRELHIIKSPVCHVWIDRNLDAKLRRLANLLKDPKKTIIFSDSIELGKSVAARYKIPHIHGQSINRLKTLGEAQTAVISRVGDEGVSLPDIERVIEISWLFGSRRQELQRFTRLLHGQKVEGEGHVLMTVDEYLRDKKRLFSILDRGFKIVLHREGVDEKTIHKMTERTYEPSKPIRQATSAQPTPSFPMEMTQRFPGLQKKLDSSVKSGRLQEIDAFVATTLAANKGTTYTLQEFSNVTGKAIATLQHNVNWKRLISEGFIKRPEKGKVTSAL